MSLSFIRLRFADEEDGTGMLTAEGCCGRFAGRGTACFLVSELESFAEGIGAYPLATTRRLEIRGGYLSSSKPAMLDQEHLALYVYPTNLRGGVSIQLRVSTSLQAGDRPESQSRTVFEMPVTYEALRHLSKDLKALLRGEVGEAFIESSEVAG
jgi:hypothetical protein